MNRSFWISSSSIHYLLHNITGFNLDPDNWWNPLLDVSLNTLHTLEWVAHIELSATTAEAARTQSHSHTTLLRKSKLFWARDTLKAAHSKSVWECVRWSRGTHHAPVPPLVGPNGLVYEKPAKAHLIYDTSYAGHLPPDPTKYIPN